VADSGRKASVTSQKTNETKQAINPFASPIHLALATSGVPLPTPPAVYAMDI
jgi:hypothetical protein